jgi:hypothetical protein
MRRVLATSILPLLLAGCAVTQVGSVMHPTVSGAIVVRQADGTELQWTPDRCSSGDVALFVGFDFLSTHDEGHLRVVVDPIDGPAVRWSLGPAATPNPTVLRRSDCARLDVDAHATDWHVNDVRDFSGYVDLQCDSPRGVHIEGRIAVDHCH